MHILTVYARRVLNPCQKSSPPALSCHNYTTLFSVMALSWREEAFHPMSWLFAKAWGCFLLLMATLWKHGEKYCTSGTVSSSWSWPDLKGQAIKGFYLPSRMGFVSFTVQTLREYFLNTPTKVSDSGRPTNRCLRKYLGAGCTLSNGNYKQVATSVRLLPAYPIKGEISSFEWTWVKVIMALCGLAVEGRWFMSWPPTTDSPK